MLSSMVRTWSKNKRRMNSLSMPTRVILVQIWSISAFVLMVGVAWAQPRMEYLDRGLVAIKTTGNSVFLSWRLVATDDYDKAFHLYRRSESTRLNSSHVKISY